jgi:tetratricopeptide (TPR) repeat protein
MLDAVPDFSYGLATYSWTLRQAGDADEAVRVAERALELSSAGQFLVAVLGAAYAAAGREKDARAALNRLAQMAAHGYVSPYHRALIHMNLGERDQALSLLRECFAIKDAWLVWLGVEPQLDPLRGEPAFEELLRSTRNPIADRIRPLHVSAAVGQTAKPRYRPSSITSPVAGRAPVTQTGENEEARQMYVAGRYYATRRTAEGLRQAIERFERAVELDPKLAIAHAELADC